MPDEASYAILFCWVISMLCSAYVWWPQTVALVRRRGDHDGLTMFRVKDFLLLGTICLGTLWRVAVWADLTFFDQAVFGTIDRRWPAELVISLGIAIGCIVMACLYHRTRYSGRGRAG
jgi:hypothetical protein